LALVALAIQIFLSFSHIDLCDLGAVPGKAVAATVAAAPAEPGNGGPADKDRPLSCPICALIHLAAAAAPSTPPVLPVLVLPSHIRPDSVDQLLFIASAQFLFRARAPPVV